MSVARKFEIYIFDENFRRYCSQRLRKGLESSLNRVRKVLRAIISETRHTKIEIHRYTYRRIC